MVREEQNIPNWILDESRPFTLKLARTFFLEPGVPYGWGKFILSYSIPHIQNKGLHICYMCTLCEKHEESI